MRYYAGIGSRHTPLDICQLFTRVATILANRNYVLRTGGAPGADKAFLEGAMLSDQRRYEVYLPWPDFEGITWPTRTEPQSEAFDIAAQFHPVWDQLSYGAKKLHARNVHQIYGYNVLKPVLPEFVICYTENGSGRGGTGQALRIAKHHEISIVDAGNPKQLPQIKALTYE